jgi:hypothetical protein
MLQEVASVGRLPQSGLAIDITLDTISLDR